MNSFRQKLTNRETESLVNHINKVLANEPLLSSVLPLRCKSEDVISSVKDGVLLCKLLNHASPGLVDESKMTFVFKEERSKPFRILENINICLNGARQLGVTLVNIGASDVVNGQGHLIYGILWQIVKLGLLSKVNLKLHPELEMISNNEDLSKLPAEELLLKWVNYHLKKANYDKTVTNFGNDIKDPKVLLHLLNQVAPKDCMAPQNSSSNSDSAQNVISEAAKIDCDVFLTPEDIASGNEKLNLLFVANLFNKNTGLDPRQEEVDSQSVKIDSLKVQILEEKNKLAELLVYKARLMDINSKKSAKIKGLHIKNREIKQRLISKKTEHLDASMQEHYKKDSMEEKLASIAEEKEKLSFQMEVVAKQVEVAEIERGQEVEARKSMTKELEKTKSLRSEIDALLEYIREEKRFFADVASRIRYLYSICKVEDLCNTLFGNITYGSIITGSECHGDLILKDRQSKSLFGKAETKWSLRTFVLKECFLFCYDLKKDHSPVGIYRIDDINIRDSTEDELNGRGPLLYNHSFISFDSEQTVILIAGTDLPNELANWKKMLYTGSGYWSSQSAINKAVGKLAINK